jgi:hypothetical protein
MHTSLKQLSVGRLLALTIDQGQGEVRYCTRRKHIRALNLGCGGIAPILNLHNFLEGFLEPNEMFLRTYLLIGLFGSLLAQARPLAPQLPHEVRDVGVKRAKSLLGNFEAIGARAINNAVVTSAIRDPGDIRQREIQDSGMIDERAIQDPGAIDDRGI